MARRERDFQAWLIKELRKVFPGCFILKLSTDFLQGVPDLLILWEDRWAVLEVKKSEREPFQPNQEYYLEKLGSMSFAACVYPENVEDVLDGLQRAFQCHRARNS